MPQAVRVVGRDRRQLLKALLRRRLPNARLRRNQRGLSKEKQETLLQTLKTHYFSDPLYYPDPPDVYFATRGGRKDLADNMANRLAEFRTLVVPWLDSIFRLRGSKIVEIGCGTGSSSISLAEQGAEVVGVDVSSGALEVARVRFDLYGLDGCFTNANATEVKNVAAIVGGNFEAVIFFAVMEHMTWEERATSLREAWQLLHSGQHLIIVETPNRLWYTDTHTSLEPFFHWLPDEIAIPYSRFTRREIYNEIFGDSIGDITDVTKIRFARWGRGISYHDLVLSLGIPPEKLPVVSAMPLYLRSRSLEHLVRYSRSWRYEGLLRKLAPNVHPGFLCEDLYVALRKP
jgi:2-polyprenyl-3-methyl-5-hydroxy-6-metoxy-1,4-benzoquinol methylase